METALLDDLTSGNAARFARALDALRAAASEHDVVDPADPGNWLDHLERIAPKLSTGQADEAAVA